MKALIILSLILNCVLAFEIKRLGDVVDHNGGVYKDFVTNQVELNNRLVEWSDAIEVWRQQVDAHVYRKEGWRGIAAEEEK